MVKVAYGLEYVPSVGRALVNHAGTVAGLILTDDLVTNAFQAAACDENFLPPTTDTHGRRTEHDGHWGHRKNGGLHR